MSLSIRSPFFEIGVKNYLYGKDILRLAQAADQAAIENDVDVLFITPYTEIRSVAENTKRLVVVAPYMDLLYPGRGLADVLPEALKDAGAKGVVVNHCEKPMSLPQIKATLKRARELDMFVFACADSLEEARAIACLGPEIINPEPTELIGSGNICSEDYIRQSTQQIHQINPHILVEQAAGITTEEQVFQMIQTGAQGVGVASGIAAAADPCAIAKKMIRAVRLAQEAEGGTKYENLSRNHPASIYRDAPILSSHH